MEVQQVKKIVVIGPESTGKSTLCTQLAQHYQTLWCPEFAREYLLTHGKDYTFDDLETIAKGQLALEDEYIYKVHSPQSIVHSHPSHSPILFIDTDLYVMKVWCEFVYGKCHQSILDEIVKRKYDLYLLCNIDLPWEADEFREYPDEQPRQELYRIYKDILINQNVSWVEISGNYDERLVTAIAAVNVCLR